MARVEGLGIADTPPGRAGPASPADLPLEAVALQVLAAGEEAGQEAQTDELVAQGLGAVVLFASALRDPARAAARSGALQASALRGAARRPLLVAADQEGGRVCRLPLSPTTMPGAMALAAAGDPELARAAGSATAGQLAAVGVNWDLAPVCDLWSRDNPALGSRCFAADPAAAAELAAAFALGLRDGGVAACAKHFPGHGATAVDSHAALPRLDADADLLRRREWVPFAAAVRAGVETVMTGHLVVPVLGPEPASLSAAAVRALRGELGFAGPVVTDSLGMSGCLQAAGDVGRAAVRALAAGADVVMVGHGPAEQRQALRAVIEAVRAGRLPRARLDQAVSRVWALKEALGLARRGAPDPEAAAHLLARPSDEALARRIAAAAVTEIAPGPPCPEVNRVLAAPGAVPALLAAVRARWPGASVEEAAAADGGASRRVSLDGVCHLLIGPPIPPSPPGRALLAYDATPASLQALLDCAAGRAPAAGRLPR